MGSGSDEDFIGQNRCAVRRASLSPTAFCPGFDPLGMCNLSGSFVWDAAPPLRAAVCARRCSRMSLGEAPLAGPSEQKGPAGQPH